MPLPEDISDLLDAEFAQLAESIGERRTTNEKQATWLEISPSQLSRIRRGQARLTSETAEKFAVMLRTNPAERQSLAEQLVEASRRKTSASPSGDPSTPPPAAVHSASLDNAQRLFQRLGRENSLLCVEYRDKPRALDDKKYSAFAEIAGQAIALGLSFAMFQPFGRGPGESTPTQTANSNRSHSTSGSNPLPLNVRVYLAQLRNEVRRVRGFMLHAAVVAAKKGGMSDENATALMRRRVILYERDSEQYDGIGIQSRLFYAEYFKASYLHEIEIWEWVAAANDDDLFIRRDVSNTPPDAIADQFHPVVPFWRDNRFLPADNTQLSKGIKEYVTRVETERPCEWSVYEDTRT